MNHIRRYSAVAAGCISAVLAIGLAAAAAPGPAVHVNYQTVTRDGASGWKVFKQCYDDNGNVIATDPSDTVTFVDGPGLAPSPIGSAELATGNGTSGGACQAALRNGGYQKVRLADLTALSYWTYASQNNGQQLPFLSLNINYTGGKTVDDTLFLEPPYQTPGAGSSSCPDQGASQLNRWQGWDALHGCWWSNSGNFGTQGTGVEPLSAVIAAHPNATIVNPSNQEGGVRLAVGEGSDTDQFQGNVDSFTIGVKGQTTVVNFEAQH